MNRQLKKDIEEALEIVNNEIKILQEVINRINKGLDYCDIDSDFNFYKEELNINYQKLKQKFIIKNMLENHLREMKSDKNSFSHKIRSWLNDLSLEYSWKSRNYKRRFKIHFKTKKYSKG